MGHPCHEARFEFIRLVGFTFCLFQVELDLFPVPDLFPQPRDPEEGHCQNDDDQGADHEHDTDDRTVIHICIQSDPLVAYGEPFAPGDRIQSFIDNAHQLRPVLPDRKIQRLLFFRLKRHKSEVSHPVCAYYIIRRCKIPDKCFFAPRRDSGERCFDRIIETEVDVRV